MWRIFLLSTKNFFNRPMAEFDHSSLFPVHYVLSSSESFNALDGNLKSKTSTFLRYELFKKLYGND